MAHTLWAMGDVAAEVGDILGGAIHLPAFFIAARLDPESVVTHVGKAIMHQDVAAGVGIQASVLGESGGLMIRQLPTSMFSLYSRMMAQKGELRKLGPSMRTSLQSLI